jgi:hypothetical protein
MAEAPGLDSLLQSFLDLWHHFDGVEARRFDPDGPLPELRPFDDDLLRQHAAACRAIEGAVLDLDLETLDAEVDRTVLLAAVRPQIRRLDRDRPADRNPTFWTSRVLAALRARLGDDAVLAPVPPWLVVGTETLTAPPVFSVQVAVDDLNAIRTELERPEWWRADKDLLAGVASAVDGFEGFLRHEIAPNAEAGAGAIGEESVTWHLNHAGLIEVSAAEAARRLRRRMEGSVEGAATDLTGAVLAYRQGLARQASPVRRQLASPVWLAGFSLFVADQADPGARGAIADWCRAGLVDAGYHLGLLSPGELVRAAAGPAVVRRPLEALETALLAIEWETVRGRFGGDTPTFIAAAIEHGLLHPTLLGWRLGIG